MASTFPPLPSSQPSIHLDSPSLHTLLSPHLLIPHFRTSLPTFSLSIHSPPRLSYTLPSPSSSSSNTLLLMPCWSTDPSLPYLFVKTVTVFPSNSSFLPPLPGVHATVSLFHSLTGAPLASLDGTSLTFLRTSAVAGLASSLLSLPSSQTLLIIGSGGLSKYLISAHRVARPSINHIFIWNRTASKALELVNELRKKEPDSSTVTFDYAENLDEVIGLADIVSCATSSTSPIVKGRLLKPGAHLDLVGSFLPTMKECDDEALLRGRVFVDFEVAMDEAGELVGAFERGVLRREDVAGTLTELEGSKKEGRKRDDDVTVFKSVGTAVVDFLAAQLAYESFIKT
ncbi:Delta(1)-pyrroline-2-carboxylate reductase [Rhynchospora pubera]|uniref:Delta(1)-pyrroline-2-carboxylate reductase n=1 Tax=Rhynchospora pubera TaxID=906938 RepID=A0AAV8EIB3_9POAL|nr:Delta(1)-pyrroline-2-carboxylate reductase [Rhynchospora pubera]